ncbi:hypothetical protein BJ138DRAFT_1223789 [Hygrophoropsis aurantiaca]|uniref:Uncharacterized protein n=1 Tax=Hygrophoropsis aurantiaca TaxID=72124 RepID=A0ACB7ZYB8_9AGAM|nr:hypothetical protein BJ138DRAFT_1223789 [Hygrophoropsis aurantiaca]
MHLPSKSPLPPAPMTKVTSTKVSSSARVNPIARKPSQNPAAPDSPSPTSALDDVSQMYENSDHMDEDTSTTPTRPSSTPQSPPTSNANVTVIAQSIIENADQVTEPTADALSAEVDPFESVPNRGGVAASMHAPQEIRMSAAPGAVSSTPLPHNPTPVTQRARTSLPHATVEAILHAQLASASENRAFTHSGHPSTAPVCTLVTPAPPGGFPHTHLSHGTQLTDFLSPAILSDWRKIMTGKFLIRFFDHDGKSLSTLASLAKQAISNITPYAFQDNLDVQVSEPSPIIGREGKEFPQGFLVHNIPFALAEFFLEQRIWSTPAVTFEARPFLNEDNPTFLFTIQGFHTEDLIAVDNAVTAIWTDGVVQHDIEDIVAFAFDFVDIEYQGRFTEFINSLAVEFIDYKTTGAVKIPSFNIYARCPTSDPIAWTKLRKYLASLSYASSFDGIGRTTFLPFCTLCHSLTHPRGLCPFPLIPDWYGGGRIKKTSREDRGRSFSNRPSSQTMTRGRGRINRFA